MSLYIEQVEFLHVQRDAGSRRYQADLCLHLSNGANAHFNAMCKDAHDDDPDAIRRLLLNDALRQMRWMPEVRRGELDISHVPELEAAIKQALLAA